MLRESEHAIVLLGYQVPTLDATVILKTFPARDIHETRQPSIRMAKREWCAAVGEPTPKRNISLVRSFSRSSFGYSVQADNRGGIGRSARDMTSSMPPRTPSNRWMGSRPDGWTEPNPRPQCTLTGLGPLEVVEHVADLECFANDGC